MRTVISITSLLYSFLLINPFEAKGQEENTIAAAQGKHYLDLRIRSIDKYNSRVKHQQEKMLKKLVKKEKRYADKLKNTDSLAYAKYRQKRPTYDSINKLVNADSTTIATKSSKRNKLIDSLKGIESFVEKKSDKQNLSSAEEQKYTTKLNQEKSKLNFHTYLTELIVKHTNDLKNISNQAGVPGFKDIDKQVFYGKAKINVYKDIEEEPTKAEDKALEYMEGTEGFSSSMNNAANSEGGKSMQSFTGNEGNTAISELEKNGFQTKQKLQNSLMGKFGKNLGPLTSNIGKQITEYQNKEKDIKNDLDLAKQTKRSVAHLGNTDKPSFKVNPMRELPFWKRIQKQYNWQVTRAVIGGQPALLEGSVMAGFKHTPKLTYGVGIASSVGLGQNWNSIHFSFQGIGYRAYTTWEWQYGIGTYVGYERMYKQAAFVNTKENTLTTNETQHNSNSYSESALIGLTKKYNINCKWSGQLQVLYDIWWQQKGLNSPIIFRFATMKK